METIKFKLKYIKYKTKYLNLVKTNINDSKIHGKGLFINYNFYPNEKIELGIDFIFNLIPSITSKGSMINHSYKPNCRLILSENKYWIVAKHFIPKNTEITINYNDTPWYIQGPGFNYK